MRSFRLVEMMIHSRTPCRFDTVFIDDEFRISQDSRGDTLVCARDGPPRWF